MKTIQFALPILALSFTGLLGQDHLLAQRQTSPPIKKPSQVLADFRGNRTTRPPTIPVATQRYVLSKVFRRYLSDASKCSPRFNASNATDPLKAARTAGQIVPEIIDMATGSFTVAGQVQSAYVISVSECNASHADNFGTDRVAIFAGQQLVADVDVDFKSSIVRKTDLDGDGTDELLMTSGDMHQGILTEVAALLDFSNGRLRVIEDLGTVTEDSCASEMPGSSSKASVVSVAGLGPGGRPKLHIDNYEASCRKGKRWRLVSTGKMQ